MFKLTTKDFISRANNIHNNKYIYSMVKYVNDATKVCIICPTHGEFWQTPNSHLAGHGCPKCAIIKNSAKKKKSLENFIEEANKIHNNKYNYTKTNYVNSDTKVCIICPSHGEFWQKPYYHLQGHGCKKCAVEKNRKKHTSCTDSFIAKAQKLYKNYDYSKTVYVNSRTPVIITCPEHGDFCRTPNSHLNGHGCPKCTREKNKRERTSNTASFIEKAKNIEKFKRKNYSYIKTEYIGNDAKVCITCPIHGDFWQTPHSHLQGHGCPKCARDEAKATKQKECFKNFIIKSKEIHKNKNYDYSQVKYINAHTLVSIICPIHGEFWQMPNKHLLGHGCPKCRSSHLEQETEMLLKKYNIKYETQKRFNWLITEKKGRMSLDFYLPIYNVAIECQGEQHYFFDTRGFFTKELINRIKHRDCLKKQLCEEHDVQILYIKYNDDISECMKKIVNELNK